MGFEVVKLVDPPVKLTFTGGINFMGAYNELTSYVTGDGVSYLGSSYVAIQDTTGNAPTNIDYWQPLAVASGSGSGTAESISVDTTDFDKNLSSSDTDVQKALETIDDINIPSTAADISTDTTDFDKNLSAADTDVQKALETIDDIDIPSTAADISTDTTDFTKNLSSADTDVQKALETIDQMSGGGGSVGGLYGINFETLSGTKTLTPNTDVIYQYLEITSNRDVVLPETATAGDRFVIKNTSNYASSYYITVKQGTSSFDSIYSLAIKEYIYNGTNWDNANVSSGSKESTAYNIAIGHQADGRSSGVAVGYNTSAYSSGVALGYGARGYSYGVAIGNGSNGYTYGVAIGYSADADTSGIAVGYNADTQQKHFSMAFGRSATTRVAGEIAYNMNGGYAKDMNTYGQFTGTTSNDTPTEIFGAGRSNERFTILENSIVSFKGQAVARDTVSGDCAVYHFTGAIKNIGGTTTLLAFNKTVIHEDDASWDINLTADDTYDRLIVTVTGDDTNEVKWAVLLDCVEQRA